jgi:hypothetical protein
MLKSTDIIQYDFTFSASFRQKKSKHEEKNIDVPFAGE